MDSQPHVLPLEDAPPLLLLLLRDYLDLGVSRDEQHHLDDHHHDGSAQASQDALHGYSTHTRWSAFYTRPEVWLNAKALPWSRWA